MTTRRTQRRTFLKTLAAVCTIPAGRGVAPALAAGAKCDLALPSYLVHRGFHHDASTVRIMESFTLCSPATRKSKWFLSGP